MYAATRDVQTLPSTEEFAEGMEQHSNYLCSNEDAKMKPSKLDDA